MLFEKVLELYLQILLLLLEDLLLYLLRSFFHNTFVVSILSQKRISSSFSNDIGYLTEEPRNGIVEEDQCKYASYGYID